MKAKNWSTVLMCFFLSFVFFLAPLFALNAKRAMGETVDRNRIMKPLSSLSLSLNRRRSLTDSFQRGIENNLIEFQGPVGLKALFESLQASAGAKEEKARLLEILGGTVDGGLPAFMLTGTAIRLIRKGAPLYRVREQVEKELKLLRELRNFLSGYSLNLNFNQRVVLINSLAESLDIFLGEVIADPQVALKDLDRLKGIIFNSVKYTNLPVSSAGNGLKGGKGGSGGGDSDLVGFLGNENNLKTLIQIGEKIIKDGK